MTEYLLAVLTHGPPDDLAVTLASFEKYVAPAPTRRVLLVDGKHPSVDDPPPHVVQVSVSDTDWTDGPIGFCRATHLLWTIAAHELCPYVFWLEHDFEFTRPVDLDALASVINADPTVAQMSLMRNAVNHDEARAGGLYESRQGDYTHEGGWLSHRAYFTTNPSLMLRDFMHGNRWPTYRSECEGRFGIDLVKRGYRFGVWGEGEPWVNHVGVRTGTGY